ncbi:MAG: class I SAM-dependent methyltransferase [Proteobacteria bacterium]|nr:class I SAM-dependent methyltransferase [Pseudomonadota bacterium]
MADSDRRRWDEKYEGRSIAATLQPDPWLADSVAGLAPGRALELACGTGHNATWLAEQGWTVDALDISPTGLALAEARARELGLSVNWIAADLDSWRPPQKAYDLVVVVRFLDREQLPGIVLEALAPGGHLVYETFSHRQCDREDNHLRSRSYALAPGELRQLYSALEEIKYEEVELPASSVARLLARR